MMDVRIGHDPAGNVVAVRDYLNDNQVQRFSYDHLNRLITASTEDANGSSLAAYNHSYTYNQIGNIASQTESVGRCISPPGPCQWGNTTSYNYTYSPTHVHAVDSAKGVSFTYDDNGNMTSRNTSGEAGEIVQEFDTENRLTSVTKVVNGQTTSF
ncbi:MAG: hypothetical protein M5U34_18210 [Chloroflexi bacterium]|nr:hypothetical protein [Chloroflexota bacterium]